MWTQQKYESTLSQNWPSACEQNLSMFGEQASMCVNIYIYMYFAENAT